MTTAFYFDDTSHETPSSTTTTTSSATAVGSGRRQNIPKSIFTNNLNGNSEMSCSNWLMSPLLSPPINSKLEHQFYSASSEQQQPAPISTMSTPNRRLSNNNSNSAWHSLWTSSSITSSPWQNNITDNNNDHFFDESANSPIDLDFLDSPSSLSFDHCFSREQRSQSVSAIFPVTSYNTNNNTAAATAAASMVDDYFSRKNNNNRNNSISSTTTTTPIGSHRRRVSSSIWDFSHPLSSSSAFLPPTSTNNTVSPLHSSNNSEQERRHSIATIQQQQSRPITPPLNGSLLIQQLIHQVQQQQKIDESFNPLPSTFIDVSILGKGIPFNQLKQQDQQAIYQVQFKVKYRTDYFYFSSYEQEAGTRFQVNDMVIVEADRGYDVGKIIALIETKEQQQQQKKKSCKLSLPLLGDHNNNVNVKRIFRLATPNELLAFELKVKDEEKALIICQAKIKQRNLNMEVVEAEYQWDRRKLTFYFKANERIDFRELVRELFKIYKTRIWMCCASNSFSSSSTSASSVSSS